MSFLSMILGIAGLVGGVLLASRRSVEPRLRVAGGVLAVAALLGLLYARLWAPDSQIRRSDAANRRQGYALGFGLGQYLKQTQPGRRVVILRIKPDNPRDPETVKGLQAGLEGALPIVGERTFDITGVMDSSEVAARFTPELLAELKATGADIVVSFAGLPFQVVDRSGTIDNAATLALWRSPDYRALQWALPHPTWPWLPGSFGEGRVLAVVREKPQSVVPNQFPAYLETKGTPAELFNAWFEVVTSDDGG